MCGKSHKKSYFLPLERIKSGIFTVNNYYHIYATQRATAMRIQLSPGAGTLLLIVWKTFGMQTMWSHKLFFLCTYKLPHAHAYTLNNHTGTPTHIRALRENGNAGKVKMRKTT